MGWKMNCGMSCRWDIFEAMCWGLESAKHCIGAETWQHGWLVDLSVNWVWVNTYRYITIVGWTSINPSYELGFTRYQGFDPSPIGVQEHGHFDHPSIVNCSHTCTDTGFSDTVRILCDRILCLRMIVVLSSRPSTGVKQFNVANTSTNIIWFALMLYRRRVSWTDHVHSGFARCGPVGSLEVETQGWAQDGLQHKTGQDKTSWSVIPNGSSLTAWLVTWPISHEHG